MQQFETNLQIGNQLMVLGLEYVRNAYVSSTECAVSSYAIKLTERDVVDCSLQIFNVFSLIENDMSLLMSENSREDKNKREVCDHIAQLRKFVEELIGGVKVRPGADSSRKVTLSGFK
mmetsp:Transcript_6418/g.10897  ORF Transcript_6418/g.10897 Transcript_6418/m.10897 type:complete len:118 (+) Transcript_6418:1804-2157(+)